MIDLLTGMLLGGLLTFLILHFTGRLSAKTETDLSAWRIQMSQLGDEVAAKIKDATDKLDAVVAAKVSEAVAAEQADHAADLANVGAAADALAAKVNG